MEKNLEQRYAVKFCVRLGKNGVETVEMIRQAYWDKAMSKAQVCRWHKAFKEGREEVADEPHSKPCSLSFLTSEALCTTSFYPKARL